MINTAQLSATLNTAAFHPQDWPEALDMCRIALGATLVGVIRLYDDGGDLMGPPERTQAHLDAYHGGGWCAHDPRAAALTGLKPGRIYTDACLLPESTRVSSDFYRDFALRQDVPHVACWRAETDASNEALFFSVMFGAAHGPLQPQERAALEVLKEQAAGALALSRAIQITQEQGALNGLEMLDAPAIGLDQRGRVVDATPSGWRLLEKCFELDAEGRLKSTAPETALGLEHLRALLARRAAEPAASFRAYTSDAGRVVCTPILTSGIGLDMFCRTRAILLLRDLGDSRSPQAGVLRDVFDLTPTESIIATRIAAGEAPMQIAAERGVTTATVRTILRNVFRKTGVNRQSELTALLARLT